MLIPFHCHKMNSIHYEVDISNDKAELYEKLVPVKLLVIVVIYFKRYQSAYCLIQGNCFICSNFLNLIFYLNIIITNVKKTKRLIRTLGPVKCDIYNGLYISP